MAGNRYVRHWLFIAIGCIVEQNGAGRGDKRIAEYYIKKHSSVAFSWLVVAEKVQLPIPWWEQ